MHQNLHLQLILEDLLADLQHARRIGDLGRLAFIAYCEVRRWAREAGEPAIAELASELITGLIPANRTRFLEQIDSLVFELDGLYRGLPCSSKDLVAQQASRIGQYRTAQNSPVGRNAFAGSAVH